ncbi:MAG: hypothetical protein G01um101444_72 [Parcubacteria group bacterium Gr01-1014_44]|nr:MAG: hypothetical protein G01um101444_72 [Parcubacteria group bacterium Gr01-1014_44]
MQEFLIKILSSVGSFSKNFSGLDGLMSSTVTSGGSLFFLFFLLVIFLIALSFGKTKIVLALLATYISAFLESTFIYRLELAKFFGDFLNLPAIFWARLLIFVIFFIISVLILNRSILRPKMSLQESPPMTILFLSILQGIFWLSIIISYAPPFDNSIFNSYPVIRKYLAWPPASFIWSFVPLLSLLFLRRKKVI